MCTQGDTDGLDIDHICLNTCYRGYGSGVPELKQGLDALGEILQRAPAILRSPAMLGMLHSMPPVHQLMKRAQMLPPFGVYNTVLGYIKLGINVLMGAVSRQLDASPGRLELVLSFTLQHQALSSRHFHGEVIKVVETEEVKCMTHERCGQASLK